MDKYYTIEEIVDFVQQDITVYGALPKTLPDQSIRQFIETRALPWFYMNYIYAVTKQYFHVPRHVWKRADAGAWYVDDLPCEIQSVSWIHKVNDGNLLQLGLNTPNLSVNLGVTNQPYLSSYVTTIGELGTYKVLIDNMSDMLDQLTLWTVKYSYSQLAHRLEILTQVCNDIIMECYVDIPQESIFADNYFIKYVTAWSKVQQGNLMGRYDYSLPGGVKINYADMISQGKEEMKEVEEDIKGMQNNSGFLVMVKK
jgi:hypothetical protein